MEHKLCWKCREAITEKYGALAYFMPYQHCHHNEPEEKPLCICKRLKVIYYYDIGSSLAPSTFCPKCGKKLIERR